MKKTDNLEDYLFFCEFVFWPFSLRCFGVLVFCIAEKFHFTVDKLAVSQFP